MRNKKIKELIFILSCLFLVKIVHGEIDYKTGPEKGVDKVIFKNDTNYNNLFIAFELEGGKGPKKIMANSKQTGSPLYNLKEGYLENGSRYHFGINQKKSGGNENLQVSDTLNWFNNNDEKNNINLSIDDQIVTFSLSFEYIPPNPPDPQKKGEVVIRAEEP